MGRDPPQAPRQVRNRDDPHSPQIYGIQPRALGRACSSTSKKHSKRETLERYGHGTPDDWLERNIYSSRAKIGLVLMGLINSALFGVVPGLLILAVQIAWIPFWAAGVINGIGHYWGYRNCPPPTPAPISCPGAS